MNEGDVRGPAYLEEPVAFELLKLLVQVAWADLELHPEETQSLLQVADALLPSDARLADVEAWLAGSVPLPPPDLAVLRAHRDDVLLEVRRVLRADGAVHEDEQSSYAQIARLLSTG